MMRALNWKSLVWVGLGGLLFATGCTVKSGKRIEEDEPVVDQDGWQSGQDIVIENDNGSITVSDDDKDGMVVGSFLRSTFIPHDEEASNATDEIEALEVSVAFDEDSESVIVDAEKKKGTSVYTEASVDVSIPSDFDGRLGITIGNGPLTINGVGDAVQVDATTENGECKANLGSAAIINLSCGGDMTARIEGVPDDFEGASFETDLGDIRIGFPEDAVFIVAARSEGGGLVDTTDAQAAGCTVETNGDSSKTVSCGGAMEGDPVYRVDTTSSLSDDITIFVGN